MAQVPGNDVVPTSDPNLDRRDTSFVGRARRTLITIVRSKWIASFVVAFAVSWGFHAVEEKSDAKLAHQQRVTACVVQRVAEEQQNIQRGERIRVGPILKACEKREDN